MIQVRSGNVGAFIFSETDLAWFRSLLEKQLKNDVQSTATVLK